MISTWRHPEELDDLLPIEGNGRWRLKLTRWITARTPGETGLVWISAVAAHHSYGFFDIHTRGAAELARPRPRRSRRCSHHGCHRLTSDQQLHRRIDFLVSASAFTVLRLEPSAREQELQGMGELVEQAAGNRELSTASGRTLPW